MKANCSLEATRGWGALSCGSVAAEQCISILKDNAEVL